MSDKSDHKSKFADIRDGLRERIAMLDRMAAKEVEEFAAAQEKALAQHKEQMESFKATAATYKRLLALEEGFVQHVDELNARIGPLPQNAAEVKMPIPPALPPLGDFFCARLQQFGTLSKERLRVLAEQAGYFGSDTGGRQTHATLVNIMHRGRVNKLTDGSYQLAEKEKALF